VCSSDLFIQVKMSLNAAGVGCKGKPSAHRLFPVLTRFGDLANEADNG